MSAARLPNTIGAMTTTPDDQDWLRLADEAFNCDRPEDEAMADKWEQQPPWRYRSPAT